MKTAITLSQVPEAAAGPFVFHDPLPVGFAKAAAHGFDAVELFLPGPHAIGVGDLQSLQAEHNLAIAAVGTGAGMVQQGLSLTDPDEAKREAATAFISGMIDFGGQLGAPAILGSMQGRWDAEVSRDQALAWLGEALARFDAQAARHQVPFLYEPLNRYESNLINHLAEGARYLDAHQLANVLLLADLFHMHIEEQDLAQAIREAGPRVGHVHFADSNRQAMGCGHTDPRPLIDALREIGYTGYLSAEIFPIPDADQAAVQTINTIRQVLA